MGGELYVCPDCNQQHFAYHSCNHKACPQCGKADTARWVQRELNKRVLGAPYFMVNFTVPAEVRSLFRGSEAKRGYDLLFQVAAKALFETLGKRKSLGAQVSGFVGILHTWNQRLMFHPHLHFIVPGVGLDPQGQAVRCRNERFLLPISLLRKAYVNAWRQALAGQKIDVDPRVWEKTWGVFVKPFGTSENVIKYLGAYVCRTAIGDRRILSVNQRHVRLTWRDRSDGNQKKSLQLEGAEFLRRYLRHVLPRGLRSIRYFGFCHPAAVRKRAEVHRLCQTQGPVIQSDPATTPERSQTPGYLCAHCQRPMQRRLRFTNQQRVWFGTPQRQATDEPP